MNVADREDGYKAEELSGARQDLHDAGAAEAVEDQVFEVFQTALGKVLV